MWTQNVSIDVTCNTWNYTNEWKVMNRIISVKLQYLCRGWHCVLEHMFRPQKFMLRLVYVQWYFIFVWKKAHGGNCSKWSNDMKDVKRRRQKEHSKQGNINKTNLYLNNTYNETFKTLLGFYYYSWKYLVCVRVCVTNTTKTTKRTK